MKTILYTALLAVSGIMLNSHAHTVWLVNLSDHAICFDYYHTLIPNSVVDTPQKTICAPAHSVTQSIFHGAQYIGLTKELIKNSPTTLQQKDLTILYTSQNSPAIFERTSPESSKKLLQLMTKEFLGKQIHEVIKNWPHKTSALFSPCTSYAHNTISRTSL